MWYPDSSYKTAQAIFDFNHEELPLVVFANWRGFSGGMMDMYEQVIKFGALIVDALQSYTQPIIIYIPPHAELRGGSWVVIDPNINSTQMEMYADSQARGGVLEAEGIVSIKIRAKVQRELMERLDPEIGRLLAEMQSADLSKEDKAALDEAMRKREEVLAPIYHQVAVQFADLHDTPTRMVEKGVIRGVVAWEDARTVLYWRLRRRLLESELVKKLRETAGGGSGSRRLLTHAQSLEMIRRWFIEDQGDDLRFVWEQDRPAVDWLQQQVDEVRGASAANPSSSSSVVLENIKIMRRDAAVSELKSVLDQYPDLIHEAGVHLVQKMSPQKRADFLEAIKSLDAGDEKEADAAAASDDNDSSENSDN